MEMNSKTLKQICRSLDLYQTPELNEKLYLHYKGFEKIENLEPYTGLTVLYLEGNAIQKPENLNHLLKLKCLYLQENLIDDLTELKLESLHTLNLNQNCLSNLSNELFINKFPNLHTLSLANNRFVSIDSLLAIKNHANISVLDLSNNKLSNEKCPIDSLLELLSTLKSLKVLYLKGNDLVNQVSQYRKKIISSLPSLTYLDDRPIFDEEKRLILAWAKGGIEAERAEQQLLKKETEEKQIRQWEQFDQLVNKNNKNTDNNNNKEEKVEIDENANSSTSEDSDNDEDEEIGADDDIDSDNENNNENESKQSPMEEQKFNSHTSKYNQVGITEVSEEIDELTLNENKNISSKSHPIAANTSAWTTTSDKSASELPANKTFLTQSQSSRASIELVADDEPQATSELFPSSSNNRSLISELD